MKKKRAIGNFIVLSIIMLLVFVFSFVSFNVPGTTSIFKGFLKSIPQDIEYSDGISATFDLEIADYYNGSESDAFNDTINKVQSLLKNDYSESRVEKYGENQIRVTVPGSYFNTNNIVGFVEFSTSTPDSLSNLTDEERVDKIALNGSMVKTIKYQSYNGQPGVYIEFNKEGKEKFSKLTENAGSSAITLYIYTNKNYDSYFSAVSIDSQIDYGYIFLSGGNIKTKSIAQENASKLSTGLIGTNMKLNGSYEQVENAFATSIISNNKLTLIIFTSIISALVLIGAIIFLCVRYREFGAIAMLSLFSFLCLNILTFAFIENLFMSVSTISAIGLSFALTLVAHIIILEKMRKKFYNGTKFIASCKNGYKESILTIIDSYAPVLIASLISIFVSFNSLYSFFYAFTISLAFGIFTSLLTFRWFIGLYLNINPTKNIKVNFVKGEKIDEESAN